MNRQGAVQGQERVRSLVLSLVVLGTMLNGCRRGSEAKPAGSDLPVASDKSVALPGATDAADAPRAPEVAESNLASLTKYEDPTTGVSFAYPSVWRPAVAGQSPVAPAFETVAGKARITQEFLPAGNVYAGTVLRALLFSYTVRDGSNEKGCAEIAQRAIPASKTGLARYGDMTFTEASGSDAGACTQVTSAVDTRLEGRRCFVFERDFVTSCPFVKSKSEPRPLTAREQAALQQHLDAVMESVRLQSR